LIRPANPGTLRLGGGGARPSTQSRIMTVSQILKVKGRDVFATRPEHTLMDVVHLLAEKRIGAVVASDDEMHVLGIISERDIIRAMSVNGREALDEKVEKYMTKNVVTVSENTKVNDVMETMTLGRFRHVPVVDGDKCIAVISIVDIVKHRVREIEIEHEALHSYIARTV
jgi:CBS domain-containing protein